MAVINQNQSTGESKMTKNSKQSTQSKTRSKSSSNQKTNKPTQGGEVMEVTIERIHKLENEEKTTRAFVDLKTTEGFLIRNVRIVEKKADKSLFVALPQTKGADNKYYDIVSWPSKEAREEISKAIIEAYKNN